MIKYIIFLISMLIFSGCSVVSVSTDFDPNIKFDQYKTYSIVKFERGDALVNNRVEDALEKELNLKNYKKVDENKADFIVLYMYTAKDKSITTNDYISGGYGRYGRYGGFYTTNTYNYTEGNIDIRMANPRTKDTFWRAEGINTLKSYDTPQKRTQYVNDIIQEMLSKYPLRK